MIAPNCLIISGNHGFKLNNIPIMDQEYIASGEIFIGKGSWLARSVTILGGVKLGAYTTIGSGAIVTKSFNKNNLKLAGIPAKII